MTDPLDSLVAQVKELLPKVTPEPWKVAVSEDFGKDWPITTGTSGVDGKVYHVCTDHIPCSEMYGDAKTDSEFIVLTRTLLPLLLEDRERLILRLEEHRFARQQSNLRAEAAEAKLAEQQKETEEKGQP